MIQTEQRSRERSCPNGARPRAAAHAPVAAAPSVGELDLRRWPALVVVLTASFLGVLDFFIVNVSIPAIKDGLQATNAAVELMIASYGLAYAVLLITGGRLGDILGRKRMFMVGVAGFTVASACCGLATTPAVLIASRVFQGMTAALLFPQGLSIIQVSFPAHERALAFGAMGMVSGAAMFSGNILGGLLIDANLLGLGWRPIFLVNVPVGALALLAAWPLLRESRSPKASRLDLGGVALGSLGLFLLVYPIAEGRDAGWPGWAFVVCLALSALTLAVFLWYERRVSAAGGSPLVEMGLFRDRLFVDGLLTTLIFYGGLSAFFPVVHAVLAKRHGPDAARRRIHIHAIRDRVRRLLHGLRAPGALARQPAHPNRRRPDGRGADGRGPAGVFSAGFAVLLGNGPRPAGVRHGSGRVIPPCCGRC